MKFYTLLLIGLMIFGLSFDAVSKNRLAPGKSGKLEKPSGLTPVFPDNAHCIQISCPYGSTTRYDGSFRPKNRYNGQHGGIDLSLSPGTPLLAIATGIVIHKGKGKQMEGIYLWLLHSPDDTELDFWVFSKYQHLQSLPTIAVGQKVSVGQTIAFSGKTGTIGGHYGYSGYPHLHLSTLKSVSGKFSIENTRINLNKPIHFDPLIVFKQKNVYSSNRRIIPYKNKFKTIWPEGSLSVWPVTCE